MSEDIEKQTINDLLENLQKLSGADATEKMLIIQLIRVLLNFVKNNLSKQAKQEVITLITSYLEYDNAEQDLQNILNKIE